MTQCSCNILYCIGESVYWLEKGNSMDTWRRRTHNTWRWRATLIKSERCYWMPASLYRKYNTSSDRGSEQQHITMTFAELPNHPLLPNYARPQGIRCPANSFAYSYALSRRHMFGVIYIFVWYLQSIGYVETLIKLPQRARTIADIPCYLSGTFRVFGVKTWLLKWARMWQLIRPASVAT